MKLYAVAAVVDSVMAALRGTGSVRKVTKTALMPALALTSPPHDPGMAVGLAGSWAGDVALLGDSDRAFRTGLFSFLVAHVGYTAALARRSQPGSRGAVLPIVAASAAGAAVFARAAGPMGRPVGLYALTLGTMVAAASTVRGRGARRVFGGAALFAVSDALLGASRFVLKGRAARVASAGVMPTYAAAQWLIHTGFEQEGDPA
ncbi:putative membrane protein YhhN [Lentzea atacamensis]|uniref:Putative membrane protein YhhN n=1 Tax=Lentzea atacamensis TaxID=531938 RepID=A0A316HKI8_9PSEU|nr:lysoplasmalogenase [Lentzea atacamensis]PWK80807.1 putative membrane protein YhhN [Lentzea atacamensis]